VFVVDDDADLRGSLEGLLRALGQTVLTFPSGYQFRQFYRPHMPGCLVLDVHMPRQNGLELYSQLLSEGNRLPVIFMTAHADVSTAVAAMKTGAIEFLEKPFDRATLEDRLQKALALDAQWRAQDRQLKEFDDRLARLNERERATLQLLLDGHPNKVIAARSDITERAVEMRRARIMEKLEVRTVAELLSLAVTHRVMQEVRQLQQSGQLAR
jgi:FixJ family two-component response regulator